MASQSLHRSQTFLGDYYRRMRAKMGTPKAVTAAAHKLARIIFHMLSTRQEYHATIFSKHELQHRHRKEMRLRHQARELGLNVVPT
jgi:transposase